MCLKPNSDFKTYSSNKVQKRRCNVVLTDCMKCKVKLERLTPGQIARALNGETISISNKQKQSTQIAQKHEDHCYSKEPIVTKHSHTSEVLKLKTPDRVVPTNTTNTFYGSFDSVFEDDDDDDDDDETDSYCVVNGKVQAYPAIIGFDTDDVPDTHNNLVTNGEDTQTEQNSKINNEKDIEKFERTNDMDTENSTGEKSPNFDDDVEAMEFLESIAAKLDELEVVQSTNYDENGQIWPSNRIFGEICLKYLRDTCYGTYCEYPHQLPEVQLVEARLKSATRHEIEQVQNEILLQHKVLMDEFFATFCKFYGREWQTHRESLRRMISVLSTWPTAANYMKEIFTGFLISGMEYSTCIDQLLIEFDGSLNTEERFEIIWELMIDPRNDQIDEQLKEFKFLLLGDALVAAHAINRLLSIQINGDLASLRDVTINILKSTTVTTFLKIDSTLLKQYIQLLRSLNLNGSKIIQNRAKQFGVVLDC